MNHTDQPSPPSSWRPQLQCRASRKSYLRRPPPLRTTLGWAVSPCILAFARSRRSRHLAGLTEHSQSSTVAGKPNGGAKDLHASAKQSPRRHSGLPKGLMIMHHNLLPAGVPRDRASHRHLDVFLLPETGLPSGWRRRPTTTPVASTSGGRGFQRRSRGSADSRVSPRYGSATPCRWRYRRCCDRTHSICKSIRGPTHSFDRHKEFCAP
jgi:hypothetical protein